MSRQGLERNGLLRTMVPQLFDDPGTVFYVGAWVRRFASSRELVNAGNELTVLEVWEPFLDELKVHPKLNQLAAYWVLGDVREVDTLSLPYSTFDYTVWLHGPEHIPARDFEPTVEKLEALTSKVVVMGCPWGWFRHGVAFGNPHTKHFNHLWVTDFDKIGYRYACIGPMNKPGSHILAWKVLSE